MYQQVTSYTKKKSIQIVSQFEWNGIEGPDFRLRLNALVGKVLLLGSP